MHCVGCFVFERTIWSFMVVDKNRLLNHFLMLGELESRPHPETGGKTLDAALNASMMAGGGGH